MNANWSGLFEDDDPRVRGDPRSRRRFRRVRTIPSAAISSTPPSPQGPASSAMAAAKRLSPFAPDWLSIDVLGPRQPGRRERRHQSFRRRPSTSPRSSPRSTGSMPSCPTCSSSATSPTPTPSSGSVPIVDTLPRQGDAGHAGGRPRQLGAHHGSAAARPAPPQEPPRCSSRTSTSASAPTPPSISPRPRHHPRPRARRAAVQRVPPPVRLCKQLTGFEDFIDVRLAPDSDEAPVSERSSTRSAPFTASTSAMRPR